MQTFETEAAFAQAIRASLPQGAPEAVREALTIGVTAAETEVRAQTKPADASLNLKIKNWILLEADLPVTELIGIVGAAASSALAPGVVAAGVVATALTAFATLAWKTWRRGARLSKNEMAVLGFLQLHGPLPLDKLETLASAALDGLPTAEIDAALLTLGEIELRDGSIVELVQQDAAGRWRAKAV